MHRGNFVEVLNHRQLNNGFFTFNLLYMTNDNMHGIAYDEKKMIEKSHPVPVTNKIR